MASVTSVNVLAPNGRRQVVKVTPNTTILQILEEVCKKQGFKSESFELRHQNRALDLTAVIRFSGLPNLASLEMAEAAQARTESAVGLVLQLESGKRVSGDFLPNTSLWAVLGALAPEAQCAGSALVYLRREVAGVDDLQRTTLRDLGLTGGRALIRLVSAATDGPRQQANVSAPLSRPTATVVPTATASTMEVDPPMQQRETNLVQVALEQQRQQALAAAEKQRLQALEAEEKQRQEALKAEEKQRQEVLAAEEKRREEALAAEERQKRQQVFMELQEIEHQIHVIGEREAVLFVPEPFRSEFEPPDEFFEPTLEDIRMRYRELKKAVDSANEAPLLTATLRAAQSDPEERPVPCVVRVRFPHGAVLQASFLPSERLERVQALVRNVLNDPANTPFTLFTTPPRQELPWDQTLRDVGCANGGLLHFASIGTGMETGSETGTETGLLRDVPLTSAAGAALLASRIRGVAPLAPSRPSAARPVTTATNHAHSSTSHASSSAGHAPIGSGRVPKWFKPM